MEIEHCPFPDDLLFDIENNTWVRTRDSTNIIIGITSILSGLAGKFTSARLKRPSLEVQRGRSLGTLESLRFVGPIPSPISGTILETNTLVSQRPKLMNDSPYYEGWIAKLRPSSFPLERPFLSDAKTAGEIFRQKITQLRVRCFKAYPDHEMFEIGTECAAVLVRLNELMALSERGVVVHVVSDDSTAYVEMERWVDQTGNELVEWRTEGNLFHFIVRRTTV